MCSAKPHIEQYAGMGGSFECAVIMPNYAVYSKRMYIHCGQLSTPLNLNIAIDRTLCRLANVCVCVVR